MKAEEVEITQIASPQADTIFGLGDDGKVYVWSYKKEDWEIYG